MECDESAPVRSAAIEYLQASEQKRSFSSLPSLLINRKLPTESRLTVENGAGYESDSMLKRTSSPPVVLATTAAASSSLAPPAKKMGKLASLMSKVEHDNKVKKERDDRETSLMNAALMRQQKAREEAERATADAEAESKRNAEKKKKELIDLTEELKYKGDDDNGSSSISSNGALSSLWSGSSNGNGIKRKLPKSFGTTTTATTTTTQLSSSLPPQKSFSLPFMMEKTIHTKRANQHPILGGSTGGFLRGSLLHGSPVMQANTMKSDSLSRKLPSRVVPDRTPLSAEQRAILSLAETKRSFFFTGAAGTGKSFVLRRVVLAMKELYGDENVFVTASTGIAACNIGGVTLHSFAGIGVGQKTAKELVSSILKLPQPRKRWHKAKCLIVDEVSMIW